MRNKKFRLGISLISVFSALLILVASNLLKTLTISVIGIFGLLFYPVCLFFVILGILLLLDKKIKVTKSIIILSCVWVVLFVLIMQLATSASISLGFSTYIINTFKYDLTAGGVIFATLLYPIYYITYDIATYILLAVAIIIITAFLIDRVVFNMKMAKEVVNVSDTNISESDNIDEYVDEELTNEAALGISSKQTAKPDIDEDIFIQDEEEDEDKREAKSILGLSKERTIRDLESIVQESNKQNEILDNESRQKQTSKPNIIVHDDNFDINTNKFVFKESIVDTEEVKKNKEEERRKKDALAYLNIAKGQFTSNLPKGFDNVEEEKPIQTDTNNVQQSSPTNIASSQQKVNNLMNLTQKLSSNENTINNSNKDLYDSNLSKKSFESSFNQTAEIKIPEEFSSSIQKFPKAAQEVYTAEVNNNIVEAQGPRPVQISMETIKPKPQVKVYKKPPTYVRPPIDLLPKYPSEIEKNEEAMQQKGDTIVETLKSFKLDAKIINAVSGPTFSRYELQMAPGISVNAVNSKTNDLSMVLESRCRMQIPIPGKNAFGIEVPNKKRITVGLRDILESSAFQSSKSPLTIALGKDISNDSKVACIDKLVHTLVAGSTGSGKSVCLHTILLSLLYKASPEDLKLLLVDPKMVEFGFYNDLPHMLIPKAIIDCDKAVMALSWLVDEMERRYKRLNTTGVRDIESYNNSSEVLSGSLPKMYYIVMVFDEVGDFMITAKKEIEEKVMRLAAKSRACGIHLILTTQRPTVDVITGTIKANLPSRIAFAVSTYQDSKTILDNSGAESLLGMGDMLFLPKGSNDPDRLQCAFVHENDMKKVIAFIKENNESIFDEEIEDQMFNKKEGFDAGNSAEEAFDPLLKDCLKYFIKSKKASASSLQGYFGIGYPRANKIVLQMERAAFVSPGDSNGRRTLYITQQEYEERFGEDLDS